MNTDAVLFPYVVGTPVCTHSRGLSNSTRQAAGEARGKRPISTDPSGKPDRTGTQHSFTTHHLPRAVSPAIAILAPFTLLCPCTSCYLAILLGCHFHYLYLENFFFLCKPQIKQTNKTPKQTNKPHWRISPISSYLIPIVPGNILQ